MECSFFLFLLQYFSVVISQSSVPPSLNERQQLRERVLQFRQLRNDVAEPDFAPRDSLLDFGGGFELGYVLDYYAVHAVG